MPQRNLAQRRARVLTGSNEQPFDVSALRAPRATRGHYETVTAGVREEPPQSARASRREERERRNRRPFVACHVESRGHPSRISFPEATTGGRVSRSTRRGSTRARAIGSGRERTRALTGYRAHSEASTGPRFERRRARARARVDPRSRKKRRQRGTYLTRIAPAVQARWRGEPPTRAPRKPRSRAARRRWRRYARADARTKTRTSPRLEPPPRARRGAGERRKPRFGISVNGAPRRRSRRVAHPSRILRCAAKAGRGRWTADLSEPPVTFFFVCAVYPHERVRADLPPQLPHGQDLGHRFVRQGESRSTS